MSRTLYDLDPSAARLVGEGLRIAASRGVAVLVFWTWRTIEEQADMYAKGRTTPGRVVTWARPGKSAHNRTDPDGKPASRAIDAVPWEAVATRTGSDVLGRKLDWTPFPSRRAEEEFRIDGSLLHLDDHWRRMVEAFEDVGLAWSGRWPTRVEYVHFEQRP